MLRFVLVTACPFLRFRLAPWCITSRFRPAKAHRWCARLETAAQLLAKEGTYAQVRMPSGEVRLIRQECMACIGQVGNLEHGQVKLGKAGRKRHLGFRPAVRGSAMTPRDHPHGGGEGRYTHWNARSEISLGQTNPGL